MDCCHVLSSLSFPCWCLYFDCSHLESDTRPFIQMDKSGFIPTSPSHESGSSRTPVQTFVGMASSMLSLALIPSASSVSWLPITRYVNLDWVLDLVVKWSRSVFFYVDCAFWCVWIYSLCYNSLYLEMCLSWPSLFHFSLWFLHF